MLRLTAPAAGIALVYVYAWKDVRTNVHLYLFEDRGRIAAREPRLARLDGCTLGRMTRLRAADHDRVRASRAVVRENLGIAFGLVVRSMGLARNFTASFKSLRKGEVSEYTDLLEDARRHAIDRMVANAKLLGANAIVSMRFDSSEMGNQLTEVVAYGTAVVVERAGRGAARRRCSAATTSPAASTPTSSATGWTSPTPDAAERARRPPAARRAAPKRGAGAARHGESGAADAVLGADQGALHRPEHPARDARVGRPGRPQPPLRRGIRVGASSRHALSGRYT